MSIAADLPEEVLAFLVRSAPRREVWQWLSEDEQFELRHDLTRGFQVTPNALRQPVVRSRFIHHLQNHEETFHQLLRLWTQSTPPPAVLPAVRAWDGDEEIIKHLPKLWQKFGVESLVLALITDERQTAIDALDNLADEIADLETGEDETDEAEEEPAQELKEETPETEATPTRDDWQNLEIERDAWKQQAEQTAQTLEQTQSETRTTHDRHHTEKRALQRQIKQESKRAQTAEDELHETNKQFDRTARRYKSAQKEMEELAMENKRMKRQLRRQQELSEELRKQIVRLSSRINALEPKKEPAQQEPAPAPSPPSTPAPPHISHLDQPFIWRSDGRPFKVTPREVKRAIDRNDEDFVFALIQAFDALRETNEKGYRLFLDRLREFDRYYTRVIATDTTRVLVDASNVARFELDKFGRGQLKHLLGMRAELRRRDCFPIVIIADASLPYNLDEPGELQKLIKSGEVQISRSGQEADELLAREARRTGAYVVTNDRTFHAKVSPDFEPLRITFRIYDGVLIVDEF